MFTAGKVQCSPSSPFSRGGGGLAARGSGWLRASIPSDAVAIIGSLTTFTMSGGQTGEPMHRRFCTKCGSTILLEMDGTGRKMIMAGTLDDKSLFKPVVNLFYEQAPAWVVMPEGTEKLPRYYK